MLRRPHGVTPDDAPTVYGGGMDIRLEFPGELPGETPAAVWFGHRRVAVTAVLDRWYGTRHGWWKLDTDEGPYVLKRDNDSGVWELAAVPRS